MLVAPWQLKPTCHNEDPAQLPSPPPQKISWMFQHSISHCKCFRKDVFEEGDQQQCEGETDTAKRYLPKGIAETGRGCEQVIHVLSLYAESGAQLIPQVEIQLWGKMLEPGKTSMCRNTRRWNNSIHKGRREVSWAAASLGLAKPISLPHLCHGFPLSIPTALGSRHSCDWLSFEHCHGSDWVLPLPKICFKS